MYAALSWVPSGASRTRLPQQPPHSAAGGIEDEVEEPTRGDEVKQAVESDEDEVIEVDEILANELDTLAFFKSNFEDPYLAADPEAADVFDGEELDDLVIRPTDAMIIAAKSGDDASMLEFHLLEDDAQDSDSQEPYKPHYYVHHDLVLPTLPLCTAYTAMDVSSSRVNLVAVGCFSPGIDIWDVDRVNVLEPVISLGGYDVDTVDDDGASEGKRGAGAVLKGIRSSSAKKLAKNRKSKPRLKDGSHTDAVMSLSWNNVQREYLASGSADSTVKVWDVESGHCAATLRHHSDKVQSVSWSPFEESALLTGSFDRTVQVVDVRAPGQPCAFWKVKSDVETCQWGLGPHLGLLFTATEDGCVSILHRQKPDCAIVVWKAHDGAVSALAQSKDVPGMLVTGSVDRTIKVWDARESSDGTPPQLVYARKSKAGAVFGAALRPLSVSSGLQGQSPFVLAYAGAKGVLVVSDLAAESEAVRETFAGCMSSSARDVLRRRVARTRLGVQSRADCMKGARIVHRSDASDSDRDSESWESVGSGSDLEE
jgi:periodic tryptophan protein 1